MRGCEVWAWVLGVGVRCGCGHGCEVWEGVGVRCGRGCEVWVRCGHGCEVWV